MHTNIYQYLKYEVHMEILEIQQLFKPAKTIEDIKKIQDDIDGIVTLISTTPFDDKQARRKIKDINDAHKENVFIYKLLFQPTGSTISVDQAPSDGLRQDLCWKRDYLSIKAKAKSLDEIIQQLKNLQ